MEKKNLIWVILISVILLVVISFMIPVYVHAPHPAAGQTQNTQQQADRPATQGQGQGQQPPQQQGQDPAKQLKTVISFINIGLIIPLFVIYLGIYRKLRSSFTLGLMAVIFALGMYAVTSCPLIVSLLGGRTGDIGAFQIIPDLCTTAALIILIRISQE